MDQRTQYLLQILETIGSPLMQAIIDAGANKDGNLIIEAQSIAALLGKTVEASISLGDIMEINPAEAQDDTLRVALAGLASPLVAGQYKKRGRVPESPDIKKVTSALQAVLTFSDNFTPTPETVERLKNLEASGQIVDGYQSQIQYIQAFVPVVEAVAAFPFGQPEAKLVMEVSDKLVKKSVQLREALLPEQNDEGIQKRAELALLKSLAALYASCHREETQKATKGGDTPASIDSVWKAFDMRAAMMESLAGNLAPESAQTNTASGSGGVAPSQAAAPPVAPVAPPAQPAETPAAPPPPQEQAPPATPPQAPAQPPAQETPPTQPPAGANPMAMFAKPKTDNAEQGQTPEAPAAPAVPPAPAQSPAETPPAAPPANPVPPAAPPQQPPSEPQQPAEEPPAEQPPEQPSASGNPMSFFAKKDDED